MSENKINLFVGLVGSFILYKMFKSYQAAKSGQISNLQEPKDTVFGVRG